MDETGWLKEDRRPDGSGVSGFPDAAVHAAEIKSGGVARNARYSDRPAPAKWPD